MCILHIVTHAHTYTHPHTHTHTCTSTHTHEMNPVTHFPNIITHKPKLPHLQCRSYTHLLTHTSHTPTHPRTQIYTKERNSPCAAKLAEEDLGQRVPLITNTRKPFDATHNLVLQVRDRLFLMLKPCN